MPEYTFEAIAPSGVRSQGTLTAGSEREVMAMLDSRGLFPVKIEQAKQSGFSFRWRRGVGSRQMASFYSQLADLLHSGVPLLRSLDILERQCSPVLAEIIREVRARVADGTNLAEAMSKHPQAFTELACSMVRAGQEGGFLEDSLKRIAEFTENSEDLKAKVIGAMAYPVFLSIVGIVVLNLLVIFFVPQFEPIFKSLEEKGQELPMLTQGVLAVSHFLQGWGSLAVLAAIVGLVIAYRAWAATPEGRLTIDGWRLRVPGLGKVLQSYALSRFTRVLGTLLHNGIPILQSLKIAKDSAGNKVISQAIEKAAENITGGNKLAAPLAACKHFPRDVVEMIAVGEESNNLDKVLIDIAEGLEKRTGRQLDLFVKLLEPCMLMVMAAITLVVVLGLLLPVFNISNAV